MRSTTPPNAPTFTASRSCSWREACGAGAAGAWCRAAAAAAALQYRLSGDRAFDESAPDWRATVLPALARAWATRWPAGLAIPNPDVPNRDPLPPEGAPRVEGPALAHVAARFEPLAPRAPLEVWTADQSDAPRRFVAGLAGQLADADVRALDGWLAARDRTPVRRYEAPCEIAWNDAALRFKCVPADAAAPQAMRLAGRVALAGGRVAGGEIAELTVAGRAPLRQFELRSARFDARAGRLEIAVRGRGLHARLADGAAITGIELRWQPSALARRGPVRQASATASLTVREEFAPVLDALAALAEDGGDTLGPKPFGRARVLPALFARLGMPAAEWCCDDARALPPAVVEPGEPALPVAGPAQAFAAFYPPCARCHATRERSPPNFLAGPSDRVAAAVRHCAPRIYVRLAQWRIAADARAKTPMPPPFAATRDSSYRPPAFVAELERVAAALVRAESGVEPQLERLVANGYEGLRPCLP